MKTNLLQIFVIAIALMLGACTNNGDIGDFYGEWVLEECGYSDYAIVDNPTDYSWRFQNDIIQITLSQPNHEYEINTGLWRRDGQALYLTMSDKDAPEIARKLQVSGKDCRLQIEVLTSSRMVLSQQMYGDGGGNLKYILKKIK